MYRYIALLIPLLSACTAVGPIKTAPSDQAQHCIEQMNQAPGSSAWALSEPISLVAWNLQKGTRAGWASQLQALGQSHDLVLAQEAIQGNESLASHEYRHFAPGYHTGTHQTGVLTASRVEPLSRCNLASMEPWLGTPKAAAITRFALENSTRTLLVANIHGVNFSLGLADYQQQLQDIVSVLARHDGPIIFAGDFNTWNGPRLELLNTLANRLSLTNITFSEDRRKRFFGTPLDHILVRGLIPIASHAPDTASSDHNPMLVSLSLEPDKAQSNTININSVTNHGPG